ncbi:MAG: Smr/MutS family protein [Chitinophagales bacterium]|nr:Smr/MutS family protein [Chitinophagales bacterium]MCZ2394844.1 Smr/MutS family protein [Chitinophagales bacterium]
MKSEVKLNIYPDEALNKLDFPILLETVKLLCRGSLGVEKLSRQEFLLEKDILYANIQQVVEFKKIIETDPFFPDSAFDELPFIEKLPILGLVLTEFEFVKLSKFLKTFHDILLFFAHKKRSEVYPYLEEVVKEVYWDKSLLKEINRVIDNEQEIVRESASHELGIIRRKILELEREQLVVFGKVLRRYKSQDFLAEQEEGVRSGRKVLAVRAEFKRSVSGIYYDDSASGNIAFIEPQETVALNNELVALRREERRELERILKLLTEYIRPYFKHFNRYSDILAIYDAARAKAYFAIETNSVAPKISQDGSYQLFGFRHPLLYINYKKKGRKVIENHLILEPNEKMLLISGPNAGGKSVVLKSTGLIQLMFQFGMMIPTYEGSILPIFKQLFIDIGDAQSIENDLSTYSSHLKNMKFFTENSTSETFVLLDELGHGTDPILGGAMAEAVLESLKEKNVYSIVTTHYANLKAWGARTEGVQNGAMSFDNQHLEPLYHLHIGSPGSSFTFEIAKKSGLQPSIIQAAKEKTGEQNKEMEMSLNEIHHEKQYVKGLRKALQLREKQVAQLQMTYEQLKRDLEKEKKKLLKDFKTKSLEEFNSMNRELEKMMREWKEDKNNKEKFLKTRRFIDQQRTELEKEPIVDIFSKSEEVAEIQIAEPIEIGRSVKLKEGVEIGEVIEIRKNKALVRFGMLTSLVQIDQLELVSQKKNNIPKTVVNTAQKMSEKAAFENQIDLRGMMKDEALKTLDLFLDKAVMYGYNNVRIIHGRGTGAIRKAVHFSLKTQPVVLDYRFELPEFGGDGVTLVNLKV